MWCRQDSDSNTILHRAVLKKYDISVVDVILKADPAVCRVKDSSDRFPVEVVLREICTGDQFLYRELPLELVCNIFEKMQPAHLDLVIQVCTSKNPSKLPQYQQHQERYTDFQILASSLQQDRAVRSINVHLLGFGCAGKSTLRAAFKDTLPNPSKVMGAINSILGYRRVTEHIDIKNRTIGCEVETIAYKDRYWRFFDYGGQKKFHANHGRYLKLPASLYLIVVPLCNFKKPERPPFSTIDIHKRYTYWLRFLASILKDDTVVEVFTVLNGKRHVDAPFIEQVRKIILEEQERWVSARRALSKDQQEPVKADVKPRLRFVNTTTIPCIDNNRFNDVRNEMNDVLVETIARVQREATLYPKLLASFDNALLKKSAETDIELPAFLNVVEYKDNWLALALEDLKASQVLENFLKQWMLKRLQALKEIIMVNEDYVLTDSNWLSSNVLGKIINHNEISNTRKSLLTTQDVKDSMKKDGSDQLRVLQRQLDKDDKSLGDLLESVGACVRVKTSSSDTAGDFELFFPMMKSLLRETNSLQPMQFDRNLDRVRHVIKRSFELEDSVYFTFPPGYFEQLFAEIVSHNIKDNTREGILVETYENALKVRSGKSVIVETIVNINHDNNDKFDVIVTTLMDHAEYSEGQSDSFQQRMESICSLVEKMPKVKVCCTHPTETQSKPLEEVEQNRDYGVNHILYYGTTEFTAVSPGKT